MNPLASPSLYWNFCMTQCYDNIFMFVPLFICWFCASHALVSVDRCSINGWTLQHALSLSRMTCNSVIRQAQAAGTRTAAKTILKVIILATLYMVLILVLLRCIVLFLVFSHWRSTMPELIVKLNVKAFPYQHISILEWKLQYCHQLPVTFQLSRTTVTSDAF